MGEATNQKWLVATLAEDDMEYQTRVIAVTRYQACAKAVSWRPVACLHSTCSHDEQSTGCCVLWARIEDHEPEQDPAPELDAETIYGPDEHRQYIEAVNRAKRQWNAFYSNPSNGYC